MTSAKKTLLLDNCAISACRTAGGWNALAGRFCLETVRVVEEEAGTGFQHREIIDPRQLRQQVVVHEVSLEDRFDAESEYEGLGAIDAGERDLWVHALGRSDGWILCGPDIASIHFGVRAGYRDRLVSLEKLFQMIGFRPKEKLAFHQTEKWLQDTIAPVAEEMAFGVLEKAKTAGA